MSWGTAGLAGQVFDGPCCYVAAWDLAWQQDVRRIVALDGATARRAALKQVELRDGAAARKRMEQAVLAAWKGRS